MATGRFFVERQAAAVLKHGLLRRYLPIFVAKTGSTSAGGRVAYLDGYAGAGGYETGSPGSPLLALQTAEQLQRVRQLECHLVEKQGKTFDLLTARLAEAERCSLYKGPLEEHIEQILQQAKGLPLFAFFDPFGMPTPMSLIAEVMRRPEATECLVTISLPGIYRLAGHLEAKSSNGRYLKARETMLTRFDASLGGDWWRDVWRTGEDNRVEALFMEYRRLLAEASNNPGWWSVSVSDRWEGPTVYVLLLLTRHRDGIWHFHEVLSSAREEYFQFTHQDAPLQLEDQLDYREARWVAQVKSNLERLLADGYGFTVRAKLDEVFGEARGLARTKHVRQAIRELHDEGKTGWDGRVPKGYEFPNMPLTPP